MTQIKIKNHLVGHGCPPFIVAEAGINHNGNVDTAFKMIKLAKKSGVDAIKFQTFKAKEVVADSKQMFTYKSQDKEITEPMLEMLKRCELSRDAWIDIKNKCDEEKIMFLSTPQNNSDLDLLLELEETLEKAKNEKRPESNILSPPQYSFLKKHFFVLNICFE